MKSLTVDQQFWRMSPYHWFGLITIALILIVVFFSGLQAMINTWFGSEEYGYGILIPFISAYLIWLKKNELATFQFSGSWAGFILVLLGVVVFFLGELSTIYTLIQYGFLLTLWGVIYAFIGFRGIKLIWAPLLFLLFMVPLPSFLLFNLSSELQLISSTLGVAVIRLFDISVYLEGNVIDLGNYQLQVVEACSGLRYLFPLMSLSFLIAYLYRGPAWHRVLIFVSSIPITIFMNSFRIGAIGVLVEYWGAGMADGFLHDFEGWIIFMACMGILLAEVALLTRLRSDKPRFSEVFGFEISSVIPKGAIFQQRTFPKSMVGSTFIITIAAVGSLLIGARQEVIPAREEFSQFPLEMGEWQGRSERMEQIFIDQLKFNDYVIVNYRDSNQGAVNFYSAYYSSQRKGQSAHSPKSCIPGDGWRIEKFTQEEFSEIDIKEIPLRVNRVEIKKGDNTQLVYYWFQQRGRVITNEYLVKWYLFWDALMQNRTDGALVRLTTSVASHENTTEADRRLTDFAHDVALELDRYIPGSTL